MNNPIWLMTSAFPELTLDDICRIANDVGVQGLELCVFRKDSVRMDHTATHIEYEGFDSKRASAYINYFNERKLKLSLGAYDNMIGGEPEQRMHNQNHLLRLIRIAALMGGNENGIHVGTFVGYKHDWPHEEGAFESNLFEFERVFKPIIKYAEAHNVTVVYENCPMEGWRSPGYFSFYNNLPATLAARKLMYTVLPSRAHGEIYDPSHDIWQHVDPCDVIEHSDISRIKSVHVKATRLLRNSTSIHWGMFFGKQQVPAELARKAGVPIPEHEWDRLSYEPMLPGFGGSDSMDWKKFLSTLMGKNFSGPFSIENEAVNSKGTENLQAIIQGFKGTVLNLMPAIWPLGETSGYHYDDSEYEPLKSVSLRNIPEVTMKNFV